MVLKTANFHQTIAKVIIPIMRKIHQGKGKLNLSPLKPYDLDSDLQEVLL